MAFILQFFNDEDPGQDFTWTGYLQKTAFYDKRVSKKLLTQWQIFNLSVFAFDNSEPF